MKTLKTKVIMSAIVLVFALVATIGSTYAWFTVTTENTVNDIQLTVKSSRSLVFMISDNGVTGEEEVDANYVTSLSNADFAALNATGGSQYENYNSFLLGAVTAAAGNGANLTYTGLFTDTGGFDRINLRTYDKSGDTHAAASPNSTTSGYIQLDFWLKNQGTNTETVVLQDLIATSTSGSTTVVNALRVATSPTEDTPTTPDRVFAPVAPDYNFAFPDGTVLTAGVQSALVADHSVWHTTGTTVAGVSLEDQSSCDSIISLPFDEPQLISVYIYLEGWDIDTNALILNAGFNLTFTFALQ